MNRCGTCRTPFRRIPMPVGEGWITGCPKCLDTDATREALTALVEAVHKHPGLRLTTATGEPKEVP